jgi:diphthamide synthase (EF-2-diphthine--ammonia ligase)
MHGVRRALIEEQAESLGLPLHKVYIPRESTDKEYESRMRRVLSRFKDQGITTIAFGDIFLGDVRRYREDNLSKAGMEAVFPLWKTNSAELRGYFINLGFEEIVTCVDSRVLDSSFVGKRLDRDFISRLPSARWLSGFARGLICYKISQKSTPIHTRAPFQS